MVYFSVFVKRGREHTLEKDGRTFLSDPRPGKHIIYPRSKSTFIPAIKPHLLKHSSLNYPGTLPVKHLPKTFHSNFFKNLKKSTCIPQGRCCIIRPLRLDRL